MKLYDQTERGAEERDRAADERDRAADERDRAADERDRAAGRWPTGARERAARDREQAAGDRVAAARDREQAARDRQRAGVDELTGALRRDRGLADLQREIDRARRSDGRLVVAFVDVDGLKVINDVHGHSSGDRLLRDVVVALRSRLRSYDLIVRYGGDEFVCALPGADSEAAQRRFGEVASALAERNPAGSVSVGVAELSDADTLEALIARADAAMYSWRRRGEPRPGFQRPPRFTGTSRAPYSR